MSGIVSGEGDLTTGGIYHIDCEDDVVDQLGRKTFTDDGLAFVDTTLLTGKGCDDNGEKLCIHHINRDKFNCHPWNLISLCRSCNIRAEGNKNTPRVWWQELYQNTMTKKYKYEYKELKAA